jgi:recombinational DNA repair protein (RecF pathway)
MLRQERYYLQDTKLISGFYQLKQDQNKIRYLYTILFILDRLLPELEPEQRVFKLLQKFLAELTRQEFSNPEFRNYLQQLLTLLGYEHEQKPLEDLLSDVEAIIHQKIPRSII